jgi:cytochrome P450
VCSSSLARTAHLLAEHPHVQQQLRKEIQDADMDLSGYDKLPYLDAIVRETLRLYPPVPTIERYASEDWVLPLRYPSRENKQEIYIKKGTRLLLSLSSANRCKQVIYLYLMS